MNNKDTGKMNSEEFRSLYDKTAAEIKKADAETIKKAYELIDELVIIINEQLNNSIKAVAFLEETASKAGVKMPGAPYSPFCDYMTSTLSFVEQAEFRRFYENNSIDS